MVEVKVDSIRVSLINQQRLVVLREEGSQRYLPIWIGAFEAEAITMGLQGTEIQRPLTHDLLRGAIDQLGAKIEHIVISSLREETFFASIVLDADGERVEIDARPSDAIALAVRAAVQIFVEEDVMELAGQIPAADEQNGDGSSGTDDGDAPIGADDLSVFRDFFEELDLGDGSGEADEEE